MTMNLSGRVVGLKINDDGMYQFTLERSDQAGLTCVVPLDVYGDWLVEGAEVDIKGNVPSTPEFRVQRGWRQDDNAKDDFSLAFAPPKERG